MIVLAVELGMMLSREPCYPEFKLTLHVDVHCLGSSHFPSLCRVLVALSGLFSGLTLGLMGLDAIQLQIGGSWCPLSSA